MNPIARIIAILLFPGVALAQAPGPAAPVMPDAAAAAAAHPRRVLSLTWSPIHLTLPVVELTGEIRLADKVGVAFMAGAGKASDNTGMISATVFEAGAQGRYYLLGDFRHGMQLGAELLYLSLSDAKVQVSGSGLAIGPFVGYKYTADIGFTFDGQLGAQYFGFGAQTNDGTQSTSDSSFGVLLNLNVGWSF